MTDIELLPLPEGAGEWLRRYGVEKSPWAMEVVEDWFREHAHANVAHATAPLQAEIEALRVRADAMAGEAIKHEARAERLAEALRPLAELDLRPDGFDKRPDDQTIYARDQTAITVGHVRRAQSALRDYDQEGKDGQN